jgi:hypothetical protein
MEVKTTIPVNPDLTVWGLASKATANGATTYTVLASTVTPSNSGDQLCVGLQTAGTYCPIKYHASYTPGNSGSVPAISDSCGAVEQVQQSVNTQADTLQQQGFTGDASVGLVKTGETFVQQEVVESAGLGTGGTLVEDQSAFVAQQTQAATIAATTTQPPASTTTGIDFSNLLGGVVTTKTTTRFGQVADEVAAPSSTTTMASTTTGSAGASGPDSGSDSTTTSTTTTAAPTTTMLNTVDMTGSVTIVVPDTATVTDVQLELAMKKSLASEYSVDEDNIQVSISTGGGRRLSRDVSFDFTITVPEAEKTAAKTKTDTLNSNTDTLTAALKTEIIAVTQNTNSPVTESQLAGLAANNFAAQEATTTSTTTRTAVGSPDPASGAERAITAITAAALVLLGLRL